jgi:hypothetical protein
MVVKRLGDGHTRCFTKVPVGGDLAEDARMRFVTVNDVSLQDLIAMANGAMEATVTDLDFLETLAAHGCFMVPPWVLRASPSGSLTRVTRLVYDADGQLDKARILVATARQLQRRNGRFGGRFRFGPP